MGGKTSTTSQSVSIPPQVLARYNAVNTRAESVATQPFQKYGTSPEAFVAPINQQQMAGVGAINQSAGLAQPYYGTAGQMTMAGAGAVTPQQYSAGAVQQYMSPYVQNVADTTAAQMKNLFGQQAEELKGGAIRAGAFGGDRSGVAQGNLANQQGLSFGQNMANIYGQGFNQAQQQFNQQQGVNLQADQANQARLLAAGQQLGGLGGAAQASALQGAQAQLGAGTLQQQTQQAGLTALYNQFQQQQAYPFQVAQFLANIAMGTGSLSGSNTTTTQPAPFFSDERMKDNIETIGKTFDGQDIVKFNYKGDKQKQIGLIAQDVERHHPEAVGLAGGMKTVDYDGATKHAARMGKFAGGLSTQSEGGKVIDLHRGEGYAVGGMPTGINTAGLERTIAMQQAPQDMAGLAAQAQQFAPQFQTPAASTAPVFNPQPIAGTGGTTGTGKNATPSGPDFTNWSDYLAGLAAGKDMNDPSLRPPVTGGGTGSGIGTGLGGNHHDDHGGYGKNQIPTATPDYTNGDNWIHRADGGSVNDPYDPYSIANIVNKSQAMYANMPHPGIYGKGDFSGLPHGAKSHVPQANLPVSQLKTAGPAPELPKSGIEEGMSAIDRAKKIASMLDTSDPSSLAGLAKRATGATLNDDKKTFDYDNDPTTPKARGGFLSYAAGGTLPYGEGNYDDSKLDIPNDKSELKLPTAGSPSGQSGSALGDIATAVSLGKTIMSVIPFLSTGGRAGYADGGDIDPADVVKRFGPAIGRVESGAEKDPYAALGPVTKKGDRAYGKYQVMGSNIPSWTEEAVGRRMSPDEFLADKEAQDRVFGHHFGKSLKQYGNPDDAASVWFSGRPVAKAGNVTDATPTTKGIGVPEYLSRFHAGLGNSEAPKTAGLAPSDERANLPTERATPASDQAPEKKSSGLGLNQETMVPLLTGLGAMLSSRSPYLASAIGEGLVAGGQSYMGTQKQAADIAAKQAEKEATMSTIPRATTVEGMGYFLVRQPDGQYGWVRRGEYSPTMGAAVDPNSVPKNELPPLPQGEKSGLGAGPTPPAKTGLTPSGEAPQTPSGKITDLDNQSVNDINTELESLKQTGPAPKQDLINPAITEGSQSTKLVTDINQYAAALSMLPQDSLMAGNVLAPTVLEAKKTVDKILDQFGLKDYVYEKIKPDLTGAHWAEEVNKIKAAITAGRTGAAGQHAVSALDKFGEMLPDTTTSFEGRRDNTASVLVRNQQDIERGEFAQKWMSEAAKRGAGAQANLVGNSLNNAFQRKTEAQYRMDKDTLKHMFETPMANGMTWLAYLAKTDKPLSEDQRDYIVKKFGNPAIFRYFPNLGVQ